MIILIQGWPICFSIFSLPFKNARRHGVKLCLLYILYSEGISLIWLASVWCVCVWWGRGGSFPCRHFQWFQDIFAENFLKLPHNVLPWISGIRDIFWNVSIWVIWLCLACILYSRVFCLQYLKACHKAQYLNIGKLTNINIWERDHDKVMWNNTP